MKIVVVTLVLAFVVVRLKALCQVRSARAEDCGVGGRASRSGEQRCGTFMFMSSGSPQHRPDVSEYCCRSGVKCIELGMGCACIDRCRQSSFVKVTVLQ